MKRLFKGEAYRLTGYGICCVILLRQESLRLFRHTILLTLNFFVFMSIVYPIDFFNVFYQYLASNFRLDILW
ncbi:MAG: hypothetical protein LBJ00_11235 [Planctomycetaceae bacterium]|nr:hypothetical protein [Planctomycetaceae bacterium]